MKEHLKRKEGNRELDARPRGKKTTTKSEKGIPLESTEASSE